MITIHRNLALLAFTLVVVMLGFGLVIPLMPFYIDKLGASGKQLGLLTATYSVMQFIFAPIWGSVSDRLGRKLVLMIGILGNGLFLLLFGLATELWMLFLARSLAGVLSSATFPSTMAYISDSTSERDRGGGIGKLGAAMGLGVILGPGLGGWLAGISLGTPFYVATGLSMLSLLLIAVRCLNPCRPQLVDEPSRSLDARGWATCGTPCGAQLASCSLWHSCSALA